jgi:hypothetical protein
VTAAPAYLTSGEIADRYRMPLSTIRFWRHTGYGPRGVKVGNHVLYPAAEVDRFDRELAGRAADGTAARTSRS